MTSSIKFLLVTGLLLAALFIHPAICFSQIHNEDCATAEALTVSPTASCDFPVSGSTLYAQSTGLGNCEPTGGDAWYSFVATSTAHTLRLYNVYNAYNYWEHAYGMVELFTGDCAGGQLQRFYCTSQEQTTFGEFVPGQIYYLRVVASVYYMPITFQICVTTPDQAPPANDACAGATVLSVDPSAQCSTLLAGSTEYATLNPAPVCANCEPYLHNDLWYAFTATQSLHVVSLSEVKYLSDLSEGGLYVETFKGDCSTPTLLRDTALVGQGEIIFADLVAGQTYRLRLYGNNDATGQQFKLCVTAPPPPVHDDCAGALDLVPEPGIACNNLVNGSLLGALSGGQDCQSEVVRDVWYRFTATSLSHRLALMPSINDRYGFEVYVGNDCNSLTSLFCAASNNLAQTLTSLNVGATYFVRVFSPTTRHFDFQICLLELPLPPNNDECAGALPLLFSTGFDLDVANEGSTLGATASLPACGSGDATHDVWYSFIAANESQRLILVDRANIFGDNAQYGFEAYSGNCGALTSLGCGHLPPTYRDEMLLGGLTAGETYFVRVYSLEGSNHDFSLYLQTLPPPPLNLDCAHAEVLTSTPLPNCTAPALGNTSGVVTLEPTDCNTEGKSLWYQFTAASATEVLEVSDVNSLFLHYGAQLAVYEGTGCGALTLVRCDEVWQKIYLDNLSPGKTYYLRWISNFLAAHTFQLCLNHFPPPANDVCAGALPLVMHGNLNCYYPAYGTTEGAVSEMPDACLSGADVWFSFKAIQTTQRIAVSEIVRVDNGWTSSLQAQLFGGDCINLTPLLCWPAAAASLTLKVGDLVVGQTYYLRFANPEGTPTRFKVCALTPQLPPVNDNCSQATILTPEPGNDCSTSVSGYTYNATPTPGLPVPPVPVEGDLWYAFTAIQANHTVKMGYVNAYPNADNAVMEVYASPCGQFDLLARQVVVDNWPSQPVELTNKIYLTNLIVGATYYVRVLPESAANISFNICVSAPTAPANDDCAGAEPLLVNADFNCAISQQINTLGATQSQLACDGGADVDVWYQFTATDVTYRFDLNDYDFWSPKSGPGGIEVLVGDCGNLVSLFCREVASMPFSIQENGLVPGQTYYLRIWGEPNTQQHWNVCAMVLPPAPANDHCVDAQALPINSGAVCTAPTMGTTLSATTAATDCHNELVPEVWYSFVPTTASNLLSIEKNANYFDAYWAGYELLTGNDCSSLTSLNCTTINGNTKTILPALTPGQTYFLRVFNYPNEAMDFSLCLTALPVPPNDACANATTVVPNPDLHCSTTYPGSTAGATFDGAFTVPDVWYEFTAGSEVLFAELLHVQQYYGQPTALYYELYHGQSCDNWQLKGRYNTSPQSYLGGLTIGDHYFIRVSAYDPNSAHDFELCLQTPPPAPVNDLCVNALPLLVNAALDCNQILHGTTAGAILDESQGCYSGGPLYDVWYSFVATSSVHEIHQSNVTGLTTAADNKFEIVALQTDDCVNFNKLGCAEWGQSLRLQGLTPGETYYVAAVSRQHVYHEFDLCVTSYPMPVNDACDDAILLTVSPTDACQNPTAGTAFGASPSAPAGCGANTADVWFSFTAIQSTHTIHVSDVGNSPFGYYPAFSLEVFGNGCGSLQLLACYELAYTSVDWTVGELLPDNTYWIRLNGNADFNICVSTPAPAPPNDACASAIQLPVAPDKTCVTPISGTTEFATINGSQFVAGPYYYGDVWYTFTATQASHAILLNNLVNWWDDFLVAEFYTGTCGMLTHLETQLYYLDSQYVRLTNGLVPGQTYYVRVFDVGYHQPSNFDICILSILPPANDECANAQPLVATTDLSCSQSLVTTSLGATQSQPGCAGEAVHDVWYQFIAGSPTVRLDITAGYGTSSVYGLEILEGDCAAPTVLAPCANYNYDQTLVLPNLSVGHTYYLRLFVPPADDKDFTICLRNLPAPPPNDDCALAAVLQPSSSLACDQATDGTTVAATGNATGCSGYPSDDVWYQFTATSNTHILYLEGKGYPLTGSGGYPGFELYEGTDCNSLSTVTCQYFNNENGGQQLLEGLTIGATYFFRIYSEKSRPYDFSICLGTLPLVPANAECAGALEVIPSPDMQCVQPVSGNTGGLPESGFAACYYPANLWYHFKATAAAHFIQLQNVTLLYGYSGLSLALYKGNDCNTLNSLYCDNNNREILATNLIPGADYYIRIGGYLQSGMSFDLCVLTVMPPVNDNCVNATVLTVSATQDCVGKVNGTNVGATGSFGLYCGDGPDVMYAFTATSTEHWVNISNVHSNAAYRFMEVLTGTCGHWTDFSCHSVYTNPIRLQNLVPGQTYYLRIGSDFPYYLNFEICVTTPQPDVAIFSLLPANNGCQPGSTETVEMTFKNAGVGELPAGAAQFILTVSGANNGIYGPLSNADAVGSGGFNGITFTDVDLSLPGQSQLTVTAILPNDYNAANNSTSVDFTSLPLLSYFRDADNDGFGDLNDQLSACSLPFGYAENGDDCDDQNAQVHPGAAEVCNGFDDDCNGLADAEDSGLVNAPLPDIACPADLTVANDPGLCVAVVNYTVTTTDNCGYALNQTAGLASGAAFPIGTTVNSFSLSDLQGTSADCSFSVTVQKSADPGLFYAYTVVGLNDVFLKNNLVQSGGVGVVNAGKKARLQNGSLVTAAQTFVKAPIIELTGGSQVTTSYSGQVPSNLLPAFQTNAAPTSNNLTIPNNAASVTLALASYGVITVGINATIIFDGQSQVRIKELTLKDGAKVIFQQPTDLLLNSGMTIAKNVDFNPGGAKPVQVFAGQNITVGTGVELWADLMYTLKDLRVEKATATTGATMTGQFIAYNIYAEDFAAWHWDADRCPAPSQRPALTERQETETAVILTASSKLLLAPNPATKTVQLSFELTTSGLVTVRVLDLAGRLVQTKHFSGAMGINRQTMNVSDLPNGMYFVEVSMAEQLLGTARMVKE